MTDPVTRAPDDPLDTLVHRLTAEFPTIDEQAVVQVVRGTAEGYRDARITQFVPIFVERESREWLRAIAVPAPRAPHGAARAEL